MIRVNGEPTKLKGGITVKELLKKMKFTFPLLIVSINDKFVPREQYDSVRVQDGDDVRVIHLLSGG